MGAAVAAFGEGVGVVRRNPRYVLVTVGAFLASVAASLVLSVVPLVGPLVNSLVVTPVVVALLLGMALAGLTGEADTAAGVAHAREDYVSLAVAYGLLFALVLLALFPVAFAGTFLAVVLYGPGVAQTDPAALDRAFAADSTTALFALLSPELLLVVAALSVPVLFVFLVVLQFVGVAVVAGGASATDAFRASWRLFRGAPGSVLGYTLARVGALAASVAVPLAVAWGAAAALARPLLSTPPILTGGVVAAVTVPLGVAFLNAYHVAYYERRTAGT